MKRYKVMVARGRISYPITVVAASYTESRKGNLLLRDERGRTISSFEAGTWKDVQEVGNIQ